MIGKGELREANTYWTLATIRMTREELAERGIGLASPVDDGTWDEAGPIEAAFFETTEGPQALVVWHVAFEGSEYAPIELRAPISTPDPGLFVQDILRAFEL